MDSAFFTRNRTKLMEQVNGIVVLSAYDGMQLSGDMSIPFRQEANLWYLSGIEEAGWRLVISKDKSWLIAPDVSEIHRIFDGGLSSEDARNISGVDEVLEWKEGATLLHSLAKNGGVAYSLGDDPRAEYYSFSLNPAPKRLWKELKKLFGKVHDVRPDVLRLRAIKQPVEIAAITESVNLTIDTFNTVKQRLPQLANEYEVEAEFTYAFRRNNADHAYDPIVAGGMNACTLHYVANVDVLEKQSLLLIDIGSRLNGYPADITRTYAVGRPTKRQQAVHGAVEAAQKEIIGLLRPGLSFEVYQDKSDEIVRDALRSLDLLQQEADYRRYFPHAVSHGLGVDVHDTLGGYGEFKPGMVLTVEPGIYIPEEKVGVRLEDNIVITDKGNTNLSASLSLSL